MRHEDLLDPDEQMVDPDKPKKNTRVTQAGGLAILDKFLARVEEANDQPFAFWVGAVILFGSWDRNDKQYAGDIDVAVEFLPKEHHGTDAWENLLKSRRRAAREAGRSLSGPLWYVWHFEEVAKFLQNRSRGISLADLDQISKSMKPNDKPFSYTILRGDPKVIAEKFKQSTFKLKAHRIRQRDPKTGQMAVLFDDGTIA